MRIHAAPSKVAAVKNMLAALTLDLEPLARDLEARVLDGEAAKLARERIAAQGASGRVMSDFDLHEPRPDIKL